MSAVLSVRGAAKRFGGLMAVHDVTLTVERGSITALIGPNGAGKTTLFNCITGLLEPDAGTIELDGRDLGGLAPDARARAGLGRTFQRLEVYAGMTVYENLQVAAEVAIPGRVWRDVLRLRDRAEPDVDRRVEQVLRDLNLKGVADTLAGDLPTGTLRIVELGRALCTDPKVLLLDEPASGLDTLETETLKDVLRRTVDRGVTLFLVEHDVDLVLAISEHVYVMDFGRLIAEGPPDEIIDDEAVQAAYLGVGEEEIGAAAP